MPVTLSAPTDSQAGRLSGHVAGDMPKTPPCGRRGPRKRKIRADESGWTNRVAPADQAADEPLELLDEFDFEPEPEPDFEAEPESELEEPEPEPEEDADEPAVALESDFDSPPEADFAAAGALLVDEPRLSFR